jgi:3-deoxy-D-manno-octulosonate 8-phosphate phosphatase (KDO 8-P phosphatase)
VRAVAKLQLTREGGRGAVREFAELLLKARGEWDDVCERYVAERSRVDGDGSAEVREVAR